MSSLPTLPAALDPSVVCPPCGKCCRYVSVGIDPPSNVGRVSTMLWLLYHRGITVYLSHDDDWFLLIPADCQNLGPDGYCGIYETRPFICREYDVDGCEGTTVEPAEKLRFDDSRSFLAWLKREQPALHERCVAAKVVPPNPARTEGRRSSSG